MTRPHPGPLVVGTSIDGERHLDLRGPEPFSPDQLFQIGSVTKTFTALLLARRLVGGELAFDSPVAELLPEVAGLGGSRPVTVGELATHRSGLPRIPRSMWGQALRYDDNPYREYDGEQLIADLIHTGGLTGMRRKISTTARYGDLTRGPRVIDDHVKRQMRTILAEIRSGGFAREFRDASASGMRAATEKQTLDEQSELESVGRRLRAGMPWLSSSQP